VREPLVLAAVIGLLVLLFVRMALHAAERRDEKQWRRKAGRRSGRGGAADPGGAIDSLMTGAGARSYRFDDRTGRWVEITHGQPDELVQGVRGRPKQERTAPEQPAGATFEAVGLPSDGSGEFEVQPPDRLPTFADVGGMERLKQEVRDTVGLVLRHPDEAAHYGIEWNGLLLHGPAGVGKTFFARAIAGEFRLNLVHVSTGDLVSFLVGASARNIEKAFETASRNLPCLLFFDEFDSIAQRREGMPDQEARRTVNQLLTSLETNRSEPRLLVMAATNSIGHLDPAVIRPGRFDRHIRIDLPDAEARRAIFRAELDDRPALLNIELDALVARTEGMTPAAIAKIVDTAALEVFRQAKQKGLALGLGTEHLLAAVERHGGEDRPTVEHWTWDSLVLEPSIKAQLQQLQAVIEDPESTRRFGVDPPTGLLLAGPPGTGKTSVAKVLAAQARCSFYPISGADVITKWVGESERNIRHLFERARANRPSVVFIDEIDAIAARRGGVETTDSHVNQLLTEIDGVSGQRGVFVIGATNRPDQLDPALLRGGRLSRTVVLGLPDEEGRLAMLRLHAARMPTVAVDLEQLARETEGLSPADLKALCQEAALAAMARTREHEAPTIAHADFEEALERLRPQPTRRRLGFA
jgi:transitional endoplasmic reticulum ATPase